MSLTAKDEPLELPGRPAPYLGFLSRRSFLKAIGATALSGVATTLPLPPHLARAARRGQEPLDELWEIVTLSPLFEQTIAGLGTYQITFDLNPLNFIPIAEYGSLVGMKLAHLSAPSQRTGADIMLTVDMDAGMLAAVEFVIGWCLETTFEVQSVVVDLREQVVEEIAPGVELWHDLQYGKQWSFARDPADWLPPPDPLPEAGWPPDAAACYYFYRGCSQVGWKSDTDPIVLRGTHVSEERSCQPDDTRTFELV